MKNFAQYDFSNKRVLVTGGGSGIGRTACLAFAARGAHVGVADISTDNAVAVAEEIRMAGGRADTFHVDVADDKSVEQMFTQLRAVLGGLDIAYNNAGVEAEVRPLADVATESWKRVLDVNLSSMFHCMKQEIPLMLEVGGGSIINTSAAVGLMGGYHLSVYTAAKHGVTGITRAAALDYAARGIRVNAICPGPIETPFQYNLSDEMKARLLFGTPMDRMGKAEEVVEAVLWLASDSSSYVTGHSLAIDGGVSVAAIGTRFDGLWHEIEQFF